eukprot:gnl/TRDRNA2_/TRDRNA2_214841_c0_seq1.p1 gnl/TRDRNA2_/TRDRNA2_214841_c0~~gnl/TRDRNA2_/TRDRNA2_214841_c0_seq1.p1  ORF type:complete len:180 (+),score=25.67 gnl/TRDRNA2_/TRDRNA2_214841_c0_seq1:57-596(+)
MGCASSNQTLEAVRSKHYESVIDKYNGRTDSLDTTVPAKAKSTAFEAVLCEAEVSKAPRAERDHIESTTGTHDSRKEQNARMDAPTCKDHKAHILLLEETLGAMQCHPDALTSLVKRKRRHSRHKYTQAIADCLQDSEVPRHGILVGAIVTSPSTSMNDITDSSYTSTTSPSVKLKLRL